MAKKRPSKAAVLKAIKDFDAAHRNLVGVLADAYPDDPWPETVDRDVLGELSGQVSCVIGHYLTVLGVADACRDDDAGIALLAGFTHNLDEIFRTYAADRAADN
jgi:hypothetical protein